MDLSSSLKSIFAKKSGGYIYSVFFLIVFSIFIVFAIKPSLTTAFSLNKEEADLKKVNSVYEEKINSITSIQMQIEENRNNLPLLNQSVSVHPEVNKIIDDIKKIADKNSMTTNKASIIDVNLSSTNQELQEIKLIMEVSVGFDNLKQFITDLTAQRRLKMIDKLVINRDIEATSSGELEMILTINGFYL